MKRLNIGIVTLFPAMFQAIVNYGVTGRAIRNGLMEISCWNPRDFVLDKHKRIDDRPYGGGPGMLMMALPLRRAIRAAKSSLGEDATVIYLSPQGRKLEQSAVGRLSSSPKMILICGRYEGVDERIIQSEVDEEWSIGDYVLTGGELPAMVLIDAVSRFIPGVLGDAGSAEFDSFTRGLLDCPHYTRPASLDNMAVPAVLFSGNHENIRQWRLKQSLGRTWLKRRDLLENLALTDEEQRLLTEFKEELSEQ